MDFEELITRMKNNNDILEEVKAKCLKMVAHVKNFEQEKCELLGIIQKKDELIEKLKCCENCKHRHFWGNNLGCNLDLENQFECENNCHKYWEIVHPVPFKEEVHTRGD